MLLIIDVEPKKVFDVRNIYKDTSELQRYYETADKECNTTVKSKRVTLSVIWQPLISDSGNFNKAVWWSHLGVKNKCADRLKVAFFKFLSDEVENIFLKSKTKFSKLFESKVCNKDYFEK